MELPILSSSTNKPDSSTVIFDPSGDLVLVVNKAEKQRRFRVSTKVMSLASPVWRVMLDPSGPFQEAKRENGEVALPEDDPNALSIVLHIIHFRPRSLPSCLDYDELMSLAILCQKYDVAELVAPFLQTKWSPSFAWYAYESGYEASFVVAWVFQLIFCYGDGLLKRLILDCTLDDEGRFEVRMEDRGLLEDHIPSTVMDDIHQCRSMIIKDLRTEIDEFTSRYQAPNGVQCKLKSEDCDTLVYGSLVKALSNAGLLPILDSQSDNSCIKDSEYTLNQLIERLTAARFSTYPTLSAGQDHSKCSSSAEWVKKLAGPKEYAFFISPGGVTFTKT